jgi:excisionase family DNA binding protein
MGPPVGEWIHALGDRRGAAELSTARFDREARAHNRGMTESQSGVGRFLTIADTAEVLNISANQAYLLVRRGELAAIKVGASGRWRVERSVLEDYIEAKYEENRRINLWHQVDLSSLVEFTAR